MPTVVFARGALFEPSHHAALGQVPLRQIAATSMAPC